MINLDNLIVPQIIEPPFGVNSMGEIIDDVQGSWIVSAINLLLLKSDEFTNNGNVEKPLIDLLITKLNQSIEPSYASVIDKDFLLTPSNQYSCEFGFLIASICRFLVGKEHTYVASKNLEIIAPKELLPLELFDCLCSLIIKEKLLGGILVFHGMSQNEANFDIVYSTNIKAISHWKEIAIDQQEIVVKECLEAFWGLTDIKLDMLGTMEDDNKNYSFEYKVKWSGGEKGNTNKNLLSIGNQELFNTYVKRKITTWFEYINDLKSYNSKNLMKTMDEFISLKTKSQEEFNQVKDIVENKNASIKIMKDSMKEFEGIINFLSNKEKQLKADNLLWRTKVMALTQTTSSNDLLEQ